MSRRRSQVTSCRVATPGKVCCFCGLADINELDYGKIYELGNIVTHYYCLLLSSMMQQKGRDDQGILGFLSADIEKEVKRGKRLVCYHCKKNGATLGCCNTKCKRIFHLPCGLKAGSLHQFYSEFRSYCINHRPKQLIDGRVLEEVQNAETTLCYICYDNVNYRDILAMLWAPCCKKNAFFHRKCVQQLANSSGYFFKCPLCNNKKEFQEAMLEHGIFIPSQDASWELVPNAFQELLYRHNKCDAETCVCPKGRSHSGSNAAQSNKWELVLCQMCGSQGIHRHCGHLKWTTSLWECDDCRLILDKSSLVNRQNQSDGAGGNTGNRAITKDVDSDSDLSVGHDSHDQSEKSSILETNIPIVRVRPGPLSYKMKEVMKVAQSQPKTKGSSSSLEGTNSSSSLPKCENDNKNSKDPKTVILIDSDEEADVIEIISEKQSPKVLTTNDGKKIEILEKKEIDNFATTTNSEKLDESSKLLSKDSKPTITSIQTVNNVLNQKYPTQMPPLAPIINKSQNIAKDQFEFSQNSQNSQNLQNSNNNSQITNNQYRSRLTMSGSNMQEMCQFTGNFNQKITINSSSQEKLMENFNRQQYFTPRGSNNNNNNNNNNNINNNLTPQIFHLRSIGPHGLNNRIPSTGEAMKLKNCPPLSLMSRSMIGQNSSNQTSFPSNSNEQNKTYPPIMNDNSNIPKLSINENDSMGIKILNVCSLAPDLFEKIESQDEGTSLKRKAETTPGTSQSSFDVNNSVEVKRTRLSDRNDDEPALTYLNEWREKLRNREALIKSKNKDSHDTTNIIDREMNIAEFMETNRQTAHDWRKTVEIWKETKTIWRERKENNSNDVIVHDHDNNGEKVKHPILKSLMEQKIFKGTIINDNNLIREEQPSTSNIQKSMNFTTSPSNNSGFYVDRGKSQDVLKVGGNNGACQRDAVTSPTISPKHCLTTISAIGKVGFHAENQITTKADSQFGNDTIEDFKFSGIQCNNTEGNHELYENSSSCDSTGLIPDNVSLSDVKFRVCGSDIVQVILYDKYRIDIKMDNSGSRSPRDSDSSPLPCPSFTDEFDDSHESGYELPRKRIRDFEFEENTLQEFPATSKDGSFLNNTLTFNGMIAREISPKVAKETFHPLQSIIDDIDDNENNSSTSSTFNDDLSLLHHHNNNSANTRTTTTTEITKTTVDDTCINCKVSIDLKKIWDLVESQPHLFSKYDEPKCNNTLKAHEINLTNVCKWKKKLLLMDSQNENNFYDNLESKNLVCENKNIENIDTNREEIKACPEVRSNLRRGLKRKCKYSTPIR